MTITPEERQQWRKRSMNQFCAEDIFRLLDALEKVESQRDAYIRETGKYARECGLQDAEIGRLKERDEKAQARIKQLEAVVEQVIPDDMLWIIPERHPLRKALRAAGYEV